MPYPDSVDLVSLHDEMELLVNLVVLGLSAGGEAVVIAVAVVPTRAPQTAQLLLFTQRLQPSQYYVIM